MQPPPAGTAQRPSSERRQSPRRRARVPMQLGPPGALGDAVVEDISLSGIRCVSGQALPVMSQVALELVLSVPTIGERSVSCQGVVVRTRAADATESDAGERGSPRYETAIFFTSMTDRDRLFLGDFLKLAES